MNHEFDHLTKILAQLVARRAALKKFGLGLADMGLDWEEPPYPTALPVPPASLNSPGAGAAAGTYATKPTR